MRRALLLTLVAVAGIALAVGVTMAASRLTSEDIGLSSEPLTAGSDLAPAPADGQAHRTPTVTPARTTPRPARTTTTPPAATTATPTVVTPPPTVSAPDDDRGHGGRSDGDGDDD